MFTTSKEWLNKVKIFDHLVHFTLKQYMQFSGITDEVKARERMDGFVKAFGLKKIDTDTYEIPSGHLSSVRLGRSQLMNSGMEWRCECGTVNSAKNGEKCLKCDFTYKDWIFKQQEDFTKNQTIRYQPITDREIACFLFGKFSTMLQGQIPNSDNLEMRVQTANIAGSITFDFIKTMEKHYSELREGEVFDVVNQIGNPDIISLYNKIMEMLESDIRSIFTPK